MRVSNFVLCWGLPLGLSLCALACRGPAPGQSERPAPAAVASVVSLAQNPLPARPEAVASADTWAVQGAKEGGREGARRLLDAAALRERIFRVDHREADALEALDLYRQAAHSDAAQRCAALTSAALLEGELRADPSATFQAVFRAEHGAGADAACKEHAEAILATLSAYRPLPTVLAGLAAEAAAPSASVAITTTAAPSGSTAALQTESATNDGVI